MAKLSDKNRITNAWAMYDWANSAFAVVALTALLPIYYQSVAGAELEGNLATVYWGYTVSIALLIAAVLSPILGAMADFRGAKKRYLIYFAILGISGSALLFFVQRGDWLWASIAFIMGNVGFAGANVFYDSILPHITSSKEIDKVSSRGFALGYLGGGILLAIDLALIALTPESQNDLMFRISFLTVAVWWFVFSIPLMRRVPEAQPVVRPGELTQNALKVSLARLKATFNDLRKYRQLTKFIFALWLYTDGIGTIVKMAVVVGAEVGISSQTLVLTVLIVQFVAIPFALGFGWLAGKIGPKRSIYIGLVVYAGLSFGAMNMQTDTHFFLIGMGIAAVQGGTQALSRSLGARLIPKSKSGEFFGFVSVTIKFAGIVGPAIFAYISFNTGNSRLGFGVLVLFFVLGIWLLSRVDVEEGMRIAQEEEAKIGQE